MAYPFTLLLVASVVLLLAALADVRRRRIPNLLNVAVGTSGILAQAIAHGWTAALMAVVIGAGVLAVLWLAWVAGALGGGDVKLAAATAIWVGRPYLAPWILDAFLLGGLAAVLCYALSSADVRKQVRANLLAAVCTLSLPAAPIGRTAGRISVPYGAAFAVAGLVVLWMGMGDG